MKPFGFLGKIGKALTGNREERKRTREQRKEERQQQKEQRKAERQQRKEQRKEEREKRKIERQLARDRKKDGKKGEPRDWGGHPPIKPNYYKIYVDAFIQQIENNVTDYIVWKPGRRTKNDRFQSSGKAIIINTIQEWRNMHGDKKVASAISSAAANGLTISNELRYEPAARGFIGVIASYLGIELSVEELENMDIAVESESGDEYNV